MDPSTGLLVITVVGIVLLLGLFGVCMHAAYRTVRSHTAHEEPGDRLGSESDGSTTHGGPSDASDREMRETGDFVFGDAAECSDTDDPRRQL
jgi:hypothetical protein